MKYVLYDKQTKEVIGYGNRSNSQNVTGLDTPTQGFIEDVDPPTVPSRVVDGVIVPIDQSILDERAYAEAVKDMRIQRNMLLAQSDYTQLGDTPRNKQAWATYRQQLRDLPSTVTDPFNVTWPTPPEG